MMAMEPRYSIDTGDFDIMAIAMMNIDDGAVGE
jgi:hypothetical protein